MSALTDQVTEKRLQETVIEAAKLLGWLCYHTFDSRRSEPGFPDLVLVHPAHGTLYLELKREKGKVSQHQWKWLDALSAAGEKAYVIRPSDMDWVEQLLRGEAA